MPLLTVIMPAYRAQATIESAIRSALRAMPRDAELIVAVDGPDERTAERAQRVKDSRLSVRVDPINRGTVTCMRRSLETTDSQLVARADADDISMPWRFRAEISALKHADIVCGSAVRFGQASLPRPSYFGSLTSKEVGLLLPFVNPLFHPSMLARRITLLSANAYAEHSAAEDYVMWFDALLSGAAVVKLAVPLIAYRLSRSQISSAPDYVDRVYEDPQVIRAYTAWVQATGMSWLLDNGGAPGRPAGTREQLESVIAGVRPQTRPYARHHVRSASTVLTES
ncbi:glycosyltransferase family 2 protein [Kocuria sp. cx-455]|uniref:glycosyltransferase family 2 protein n=1 Tax=Kocuria sp. cx-455 TaxID=2771377 RepID=UPI003D7225A5